MGGNFGKMFGLLKTVSPCVVKRIGANDELSLYERFSYRIRFPAFSRPTYKSRTGSNSVGATVPERQRGNCRWTRTEVVEQSLDFHTNADREVILGTKRSQNLEIPAKVV